MPPKKRTGSKDQNEAPKGLEGGAWTWKVEGTCIIGQSPGIKGSEKIASFDMDDTIVRPKSGAKFAKDATDWVWLHECVPKIISNLFKDGYKIVIFTNQMGVENGKTNINDLKKKVADLAKEMEIQMQVFIAPSDDEYRKPSTKMWTCLENSNDKIQIDKSKSFYCGDAAGRKTAKHKDFSDSDIKFGLNVGVEFKTPQNLYFNDKQKVEVQGFNPATIPQNGDLIVGKKGSKDVEYVDKEMVVFCGSPGSGKSTFWKNYMSKYERVNRDTLKTKEKCYKVAEDFIKQGKSVIIDNTCPKKEDRKYFIDLAKKYGFKVRCFSFLTPKEICFHNDFQRVANSVRPHLSDKAGSIPIHSWFKYKENPELNEGFYEVNEVNFIAKFESDKDKQAYLQFSKK